MNTRQRDILVLLLDKTCVLYFSDFNDVLIFLELSLSSAISSFFMNMYQVFVFLFFNRILFVLDVVFFFFLYIVILLVPKPVAK